LSARKGFPDEAGRPAIPPVQKVLKSSSKALFDYCAAMAKKKNTKKTEKNLFLGNLDRLGGKKLMQHGAEESSRGKESRKHRVGGRRQSG
jgi:hypothetical protein